MRTLSGLGLNRQHCIQLELIAWLHALNLRHTHPPPAPPSVWPHLFRGAGHEKRRGEQCWSGPWHLGCTSEVFHVHSYQDQFTQPGWTECAFVLPRFVLVCLFCSLWFIFMSPFFHDSLSSWVISLTVLGASVTNLNKPPRALAIRPL